MELFQNLVFFCLLLKFLFTNSTPIPSVLYRKIAYPWNYDWVYYPEAAGTGLLNLQANFFEPGQQPKELILTFADSSVTTRLLCDSTFITPSNIISIHFYEGKIFFTTDNSIIIWMIKTNSESCTKISISEFTNEFKASISGNRIVMFSSIKAEIPQVRILPSSTWTNLPLDSAEYDYVTPVVTNIWSNIETTDMYAAKKKGVDSVDLFQISSGTTYTIPLSVTGGVVVNFIYQSSTTFSDTNAKLYLCYQSGQVSYYSAGVHVYTKYIDEENKLPCKNFTYNFMAHTSRSYIKLDTLGNILFKGKVPADQNILFAQGRFGNPCVYTKSGLFLTCDASCTDSCTGPNSNECVALCHPSCKTCSGPADALSSNCITCQDGFYLSDGNCVQCHRKCLTCSASTRCDSCKPTRP